MIRIEARSELGSPALVVTGPNFKIVANLHKEMCDELIRGLIWALDELRSESKSTVFDLENWLNANKQS